MRKRFLREVSSRDLFRKTYRDSYGKFSKIVFLKWINEPPGILQGSFWNPSRGYSGILKTNLFGTLKKSLRFKLSFSYAVLMYSKEIDQHSLWKPYKLSVLFPSFQNNDHDPLIPNCIQRSSRAEIMSRDSLKNSSTDSSRKSDSNSTRKLVHITLGIPPVDSFEDSCKYSFGNSSSNYLGNSAKIPEKSSKN